MIQRSITTFLDTARAALLTCALAMLAVMATGMLQSAYAGCGDVPLAKKMSFLGSPQTGGFLKTGFMKVTDEDSSFSSAAPIVGLWAFEYIAEGNEGWGGPKDGTMVDGGNTLFFAEGNEITVSGVRDPNTGSVCLGIWKRTGDNSYELNHIGLSWNPAANPPASLGPAFIKQWLTLAKDGNNYNGYFTINQLKSDGVHNLMPTITGRIHARRVTLTTDTQAP
jgi:hypothetical protein